MTEWKYGTTERNRDTKGLSMGEVRTEFETAIATARMALERFNEEPLTEGGR